ncbi:hypothetical protein PF008_g20857 [Phytophthora fragariae]|uniref:SET domain-containing protein n=1 Tax=Phytophthora fragariae TaxID=53985 RepID=A0A6G0QYA2_9STRA|nr:hypothetical protein PF008_g20857 [Phytophthora fragariae]
MRQLKLDAFLVHGNDIRQVPVHRENNPAFAEYEEASQNVYVSRARKDPLDDIPYCRCEARADWRLTCGADCDNRATQTECVQGYCASRTKCGNQRIQDGVHADLILVKNTGKGVSLVADAPINEDDLVIQYVGEVLSRNTYPEREQRVMVELNSRHTYGMEVTSREVIDARRIGGLARFANRSCCPNCTIERWEVAGETCCGIFAKQAISRGDEITINYGNEFVQPDRRKRCLCAADSCKGFM